MSYQNFSHNVRHRVSSIAVVLVFALIATLAFGATFTLVAHGQETNEEEVTTQEEVTTEETTTETEGTAEETAETTDDTPDDATDEEVEESADGEDGTSTDDTEDGTDDGDESTDDSEEATDGTGGDASVETGDADSSLDAGSEVNTNDTETPTEGSVDTEVTNENDATADTDAQVLSETGDNVAEGTTNAEVTSGNAVSTANILNVVNTNIFNAQGLFYFLNVLMGNIAFDLRSMFSILSGDEPDSDAGCTIDSCTDDDTTVTISNQNSAVVNNDVEVGAETGENSASASAGNASVSTGNAYAAANVVNLVNTNITGSNYLLLSMNGLGGGDADIIFPGAEWFYELLGGGAGVSSGSSVAVANNNTAEVTTNGDVNADTGNNTATGTSATVSTGDATARANVVNQVNTNIFGDSISLLFRVSGDWAGEVFGLPDGMSWSRTNEGVEIFLDPSGASTPMGSTDYLSVENNNTATVTNNVSVVALTGDNEVEAGDGHASATTGDAQAAANVVNVVNTNVLGRNWILAIFNILGDWTGDISFGQPDLWIGARALAPIDVRGGSCFDYELTINNFGDAAANNVILEGFYDRAAQRIEMFEETLTGRMQFHMGRIAAGTSETITLPACLSRYVGAGSAINTVFTIEGYEPETNTNNNQETIGIVTVASAGGGALRLGPAELNVTKEASTDELLASTSVEYKITIENTGDPVYNALLIDTIYNDQGHAIHEQRWGLETIFPGETIIVEYSAFFNGSTTAGVYTNEAFISGTERHPDYETNLGNPVDSPIASVQVTVLEEEVEEVEEEQETTVTQALETCEPIITDYIRFGVDNDRQQVSKLQYFLRTIEQVSDVTLTALYDQKTHDAVHAFQRKYASDILTPWGAAQSTGYVYYTTQKKINELWCLRDFPLTPTQQGEIEAFKKRVDTYEENNVPLPDDTFELIGAAPAAKPETTDAIAVREQPPVLPGKETAEEMRDQVAAASEAIQNEVAESMWASLKSKLGSMFERN